MFALKFNLLKVKSSIKFTTFLSGYESNYQILTDFFELHPTKANNYIVKQRLSHVDTGTLMKTIMFCKKIGFSNKDILGNPLLLRTQPNTLDQYYTVMNEGGFQKIAPQVLAKFRTLYRKKICALKEAGLINHNTDVAKRFISFLNPCPDNFYVETDGDSASWADVHFQVLSEYLKWRLQITDADVEKLVNVHRGIYRKSFKYLCENIMMAESLGFSAEKMLKYGYVLHSYPKYTKAILEKYPIIAGACMRKAMRMYPKLATVSPTNIEKIYNMLKEHNIPDIAIQKRMNVFQLSPETVAFRLNELKTTDDFKVLLNNPNILKLVVHHNRAKSRLSFLKQLELKCAGVSVLGNDDEKFDIRIKGGRDANTLPDIHSFLKGKFNTDIQQCERILKKHPYYLQIPLVSMEESYNYLKNKKITSNAIFNVIYILLYPVEKVKKSFEQVESFEKQRSKSLNQIKKLNLAVYFIEKEYHFTGDGVWTKSDIPEEVFIIDSKEIFDFKN